MMRVYHNLPVPPLDTPSNLSIGNFDGVHLGHQALLRAMVVDAHGQDRLAGLLTFDPHPASVLRPHSPQPYLTTIAERLAVLQEVGLDFVVVYPFTLATAGMPAAIFIERLKEALRLEALWVGPDFALGRNREGDVDTLRVLGKGLGFTLHTIDPQLIGGDEVRSGRIRQHLQEGQVEIAAQLLGRPYWIDGIVVDGAHRGRTIGFPTANLSVPPGRLLPANGVYATWVILGDAPSVRLPSVTNVGVRPSFDNGQRTVETHLLDFSGDLYGCPMALEFVAHLRPEMRFATVEALRERIGQDAAAARGILGREWRVESGEWRVESGAMRFYREVEHTADWAIEVWGETVEALFAHAAMAMFELQGADLAAEPDVTATASCQAMDLETLLVGWLNELLYLSEVEGALFTRFEIALDKADEPRMTATARGTRGRGHLAHVKAVTYYHLSVQQTPAGWRGTVTFDT